MISVERCEVCNKEGNRPIGLSAPPGWLYLEARDGDDPGAVIMVYACDKLCAEQLWLVGPGPRLDEDRAVVERLDLEDRCTYLGGLLARAHAILEIEQLAPTLRKHIEDAMQWGGSRPQSTQLHGVKQNDDANSEKGERSK